MLYITAAINETCFISLPDKCPSVCVLLRESSNIFLACCEMVKVIMYGLYGSVRVHVSDGERVPDQYGPQMSDRGWSDKTK